MLRKLEALANRLDKLGLYDEANTVDSIIKSAMGYKEDLGLNPWNHGLSDEETKLLQKYTQELVNLYETHAPEKQITDFVFDKIVPFNHKIMSANEKKVVYNSEFVRRLEQMSDEDIAQLPDSDYRQLHSKIDTMIEQMYDKSGKQKHNWPVLNRLYALQTRLSEVGEYVSPKDRPGGYFGERLPKK